jgi:hypothetical protein
MREGQQAIAREHLIGMACEGVQQVELHCGQAELDPGMILVIATSLALNVNSLAPEINLNRPTSAGVQQPNSRTAPRQEKSKAHVGIFKSGLAN